MTPRNLQFHFCNVKLQDKNDLRRKKINYEYEIHLKTFVQKLPRSLSLGVVEISEKAR